MAIIILVVLPLLLVAADWLPPRSWLARALDSLSDTCPCDECGAGREAGPDR